jgi:hypothetical protein
MWIHGEEMKDEHLPLPHSVIEGMGRGAAGLARQWFWGDELVDEDGGPIATHTIVDVVALIHARG